MSSVTVALIFARYGRPPCITTANTATATLKDNLYLRGSFWNLNDLNMVAAK